MSFLPLIFGDYNNHRPSRILDQHFGHGLDPEDLLSPLTSQSCNNLYLIRHPRSYYRPWKTEASKQDSGSTLNLDKDKYQISLDVQQFAPEEISVKMTGENMITIEGKHEEKQDEHGFISRHFVRRYVLPEGLDMDKIESKLSTDGVLSITAPKIDAKQIEHRHIPILKTGQPSRAVENKQQEKPEK